MTISAASVDSTFELMQAKLHKVVPDFVLRYKAELVYKINQLKEKRGAIILGHNYMEPALYHTVADVVGDSLELARKAASTNKDPIVFCGVRFMAETAKLLNPDKTVLLPSEEADCSLAASITAEDVRQLRQAFPGVPIIAYINTYAEVKAESDICCTSSNAAKVVEALDSDTVILIPDQYLALNVANETGKRIIFPAKEPEARPRAMDLRNYQIIGWHGRCVVHEIYSVLDIRAVRKQVPGVVVLAHPECSAEVVHASDFSGSTAHMIEYVRNIDAPYYLLLTECTMGDNIIAEDPRKEIVRLCSVRCPFMNEITLEDTLSALQENQHVVEIPEEIRAPAKRALDRMMEIQ